MDPHVRQIRNIQITGRDLQPLHPGKTKLPSTTINAFGAFLQQNARDNRDFAILSSWLGPIATGKIKDGGIEGLFADHVMAATESGLLDELLALRRWGIPLCINEHWVLGFVDFMLQEAGIYDSKPELGTHYYAARILHAVVDKVRELCGRERIEWASYKKVVRQPPEGAQQHDVWACGVFVMMAEQSFASGVSYEDVCSNQLIELTKDILKPKGKNRALTEATETTAATEHPPDQDPDENTQSEQAEPTPRAAEPVSRLAEELEEVAMTDDTRAKIQKKRPKSVKSDDEESDDTGYATDRRKSTKRRRKQPSDKASSSRGERTDPVSRKALLEEDKWTRDVQEHSVFCAGCKKTIKLRSDVVYAPKPWEIHKTKCKYVKGEVTGLHQFFDPNAPRNPITKRIAPSMSTAVPSSTPAERMLLRPASRSATPELAEVECKHLGGDRWIQYINRTRTRTLGGISMNKRGILVRVMFPYKPFSPILASGDDERSAEDSFDEESQESRSADAAEVKIEVPTDGNREVLSSKWTKEELQKHDNAMRARARWEVDAVAKVVRSTKCEKMTSHKDGICRECRATSKDASLKAAVRKANAESKKPLPEQAEIHALRAKYAPSMLLGVEGRQIHERMQDPLLFKAFQHLESNKNAAGFLSLYEYAIDGKLKNYETFTQICDVLVDKIRREESGNPNAKFGTRYPTQFMNFMVLLRSYGGRSAHQYGILTGQIPGPSPRRLRSVVANSEDSLQNPYLIPENMARVRRLMDAVKYTGPLSFGSDCTKVRQRLTYSTDYGSHILGSVLPWDECEVHETDDIDSIIKAVDKKAAKASQVRAVLVNMLLPGPQYPPIVVALIPTDGKDGAPKIHELHKKLLKIAAGLDMHVISGAGDGAASEIAAQNLMDNEASELEPLRYKFPRYGIDIQAPVFEKTGPFFENQDPPHGGKTARNNLQHGTKASSLGRGYVTNQSLIGVYNTGRSGLVHSDVYNVDKQDDGAARRFFHATVLEATTTRDANGTLQVDDKFTGLFVYNFILGELFDAWMNRRMGVRDRILAVVRARFFLHIWYSHIVTLSSQFPDLYSLTRSFISPAAFNIFNRLCDSLLIHALAYSKFYPTHPFCPWLMGTNFIEHFFGLARSLLPNFTFAELLKMIKHIMLQQRLLLSGKFNIKKERTSRAGYIMDYDATPLTEEELVAARVTLTELEINQIVILGWTEASQICKCILYMPIPSFPLRLVPLSGPPKKHKAAPVQASHDDGEDDDDFEPYEYDDWTGDDESHVNGCPDPNVDFGEPTDAAGAAAHDTARYTTLCDEYEATLSLDTPAGVSDDLIQPPPPLPTLLPSSSSLPSESYHAPMTALQSSILDVDGIPAIEKMIQARHQHQYTTRTRSERVIRLDTKFETPDNKTDEKDPRSRIKELSHRVRIAQALDGAIPKAKTSREARWLSAAKAISMMIPNTVLPNVATKNINSINPLRLGHFVIMRNPARTYIGEILDILLQGNNSRYGSAQSADGTAGLSSVILRVYRALPMDEDDEGDDTDGASAPHFTLRKGKYELHTHAHISQVMYHLGRSPFDKGYTDPVHLVLNEINGSRWLALNRQSVQQKLFIKIPARKTPASNVAP
ncbi:hypothetical protein HWV62_25914 [Athelia sp. TMB]|nr:hypothetical protein HWV62_25914 [Athelia sp. TMB]